MMAGSKRAYRAGVKVLRPICTLFEKLAGSVTQKLMVCYLNLEGLAVPCVVEIKVIGMYERYFLVCDVSFSMIASQKFNSVMRLTRCLCCKDILVYHQRWLRQSEGSEHSRRATRS